MGWYSGIEPELSAPQAEVITIIPIPPYKRLNLYLRKNYTVFLAKSQAFKELSPKRMNHLRLMNCFSFRST